LEKTDDFKDSTENSFRIHRPQEVNINIDEHLLPIKEELKLIESRVQNKISRISDHVDEYFKTFNDQMQNMSNLHETSLVQVK